MNAAPATDRCPRCGGGFHCGVADAGPCACTTLRLSAALLAQLRQAYSGCLCLRCLAELSEAGDALHTRVPHGPMPLPGDGGTPAAPPTPCPRA